MTFRSAPAALLLAACAATGSFAQTTPSPTASPNAVPAAATGKGMSLQRFMSRQQARLMAGDKDGDGRISQAEFTAAHPQGNATRQFARTDTDHDGFITAAEVQANLTTRFHKLDANGDGMLDATERPKAGAAHGAEGAGDSDQQ